MTGDDILPYIMENDEIHDLDTEEDFERSRAKLIYVDIDETICTRVDARNLDYSQAQPMRHKIDKVNRLYDNGNTIVYWTARGTKTGINWFQVTYNQLVQWGCKFHELRMGKPAYDIMYCDKTKSSID